MRKFAVLLVVLACAAGVALAGEQVKGGVVRGHPVPGEFVSADTANNTVTFKDAEGKTLTAPVEGKALEMLKSFKPGDKITLYCRDTEKGEHQAVIKIKPAKAPAPTEKKL